MPRVSHVITGLGVGGAEKMLVKLLGATDRQRFPSQVIALSSDAALAPEIRRMGIDVENLDIAPRASNIFSAVARVTRAIRAFEPDLVQTWLYHGDFVGGLAAKRLGIPVVWNIQSSTFEQTGSGRWIMWTVNCCARVSRFIPREIVSCSHVAVGVHRKLGYRGKFRVIPNGIDVDVFKPDDDARRAVRAELGIGDDVPVIGMVARFHAQKDHATFFAAAADLVRTHPDARFLLCGLGLDPANAQVTSMVKSLGLQDHVVLAGLRSDVPRILNALDIHTLASAFGEGFPNVIGEAMATGIPNVVTDVGDSAIIVSDTGVGVPPRNPAALANGWRRILDLPAGERERLRTRARLRVISEFTLASAVTQYEALYDEIADGTARKGRLSTSSQ